MLKAEKQAIICTLYTQQTIQAWQTSPVPLVCLVPERQNPHLQKKKKKNLRSASTSSPDHVGGGGNPNHTEQNK